VLLYRQNASLTTVRVIYNAQGVKRDATCRSVWFSPSVQRRWKPSSALPVSAASSTLRRPTSRLSEQHLSLATSAISDHVAALPASHQQGRRHTAVQFFFDSLVPDKCQAFNHLTGRLKPQSNGPLYSNTVIGTLAVDEWAITFGTAKRSLCLCGLQPNPVPFSLYQM